MINVTCVTIDCADPDLVSLFWADALGWRQVGKHRAEPPDGGIFLEFTPVPESKTIKNRVHLGLNSQDLDLEIDRLVGLGASIAWEEEFPEGWPFRNVVLRDPEGNEFCLGNDDQEQIKELLGIT
jgi:catechol 2,3-dioxygenase-like lactoylglutathione lyase family enzyme